MYKLKFPNIDKDLHLTFTEDEIMGEFFWYLNHPEGSLSLVCGRNKIVKLFQQDTFYKKEKEMWKDDSIKERIITNRLKYTDKLPSELTTYDILSGFKLSAMNYGYSGFNPQLCKWFYQWIVDNVGIPMRSIICYDPCGGWGHRMIGSTKIEKYIYNDLSKSTYEGVCNIKDRFEFFNAETYNEDARVFVPDDDFNVMFTCPPYYNVEEYECGKFVNREEYDDLINKLFDVFKSKESCKVFGMVIREDMLGEHINWNYRFLPTKNKSAHIIKDSKNIKEYLYIWVK